MHVLRDRAAKFRKCESGPWSPCSKGRRGSEPAVRKQKGRHDSLIKRRCRNALNPKPADPAAAMLAKSRTGSRPIPSALDQERPIAMAWKDVLQRFGDALWPRPPIPGEIPGRAMEAARPRGGPVTSRHAELIRRIKVAYGHTDEEVRLHLIQPIAAVSDWLHLLPGPPGSGFERTGGASEQALLNCLWCLQAAEGQTFDDRRTGTHAEDGAQRWRLACGLGGLFVSMSDVLARVEVVSDQGEPWAALAMPMQHWLQSRGIERYRHRWVEASRAGFDPGIYVASRCLTADLVAYLSDGGAAAFTSMLTCIAKSDGAAADAVGSIVRRTGAAMVVRHGREGDRAERRLVRETLRQLFATPDWLPNSPGGHVWYAVDGLFLLWPEAGIRMLDALSSGHADAGAVYSLDSLLEELRGSAVIDWGPATMISIRPPGHATPHLAVRITDVHGLMLAGKPNAKPLTRKLEVGNERGGGEDPMLLAPKRPARSADRDDGGVGTSLTRAASLPAASADPQSVVTQQASLFEADRLGLDTSRIANGRTRAAVAEVMARLDDGFSTMKAEVTPTGIFVALTEFGDQGGDTAAIVRDLHGAGLLAADPADPSRRVGRRQFGPLDVAGVILNGEALHGYQAWRARVGTIGGQR